MSSITRSTAYYETSAEAISSFLSCVDGKVLSFEGTERRAHKRYVVAIRSLVQPMDDRRRPNGRAFNAATRDISVGGIGLIHTQPVVSEYLGVRLSSPRGDELQVLVKVLRCAPLGSYYDIAGEFVLK